MRAAAIVAAVLALVLALCTRAIADPTDAGDDASDRASTAPRAHDSGEPGDDAKPAALGPPQGPPIGAVLSAAYAAAGLDRDPSGGWNRRARLAGLVPWLAVRTGRNASWQDEDAEVGHGTSIEVRATWRLDRLVFDPRELQVARIEAGRRRERGQLASQVIRAYFAWRRAAGAQGADHRTTPRAAEAAAEVDALTDGWFSEELARRPGSPPFAPGARTRPAAVR